MHRKKVRQGLATKLSTVPDALLGSTQTAIRRDERSWSVRQNLFDR